MLYSFDECIKKYKNQYQVEKMLQAGELFKIDRGIYSDKKRVSETEIISFKYPEAVFTMDSAYYFHGLTDVIPEKYYLSTERNAAKITMDSVKQVFCNTSLFSIGVETISYQNMRIKIYDKERMLIELIRNKKTLALDYYKEIISSYRKITNDLDIEKMQEYISNFPKRDYILNTIQFEVM